MWKDRSVLVTGGASFIGSHLVDSLLKRGALVTVADDFSSGKLKNLEYPFTQRPKGTSKTGNLSVLADLIPYSRLRLDDEWERRTLIDDRQVSHERAGRVGANDCCCTACVQ